MRLIALVLIALFPLVVQAGAAAAGGAEIVVEKPWARASIGTSRPSAAYMTIVNRGTVADRLVGIAAPVAGLAEVHETRIADGKARMVRLHGLAVPAGGRVELAPGGYHIMLMRLKAPIKEGTRIPLTLTFERAGKVTVEAVVMAPGSSGNGHHH